MKRLLLLPVLLTHFGSQAGCLNPIELETISLRVNAPAYAERGSFVEAPAVQQAKVSEFYVEAAKSGTLEQKFPAEFVKRVTAKDAGVDLRALSSGALSSIQEIGKKSIHELSVITSAAGLWSRGGGVVKALVPINIKDLLSVEKLEELTRAGKIINMKKVEDVVAATKISNLDDALSLLLRELNIERESKGLVLLDFKTMSVSEIEHKIGIKLKSDNLLSILQEAQSAKIRNIIRPTVYHENAMNALDMDFVNLALASKNNKTYIPFDIWTSEQTHGPVRDYLWWLRDNYKMKTFHVDAAKDQKIKIALDEYFKESLKRKQTFLLGRQEGFKAMDLKGQYIPGTPEIGLGAGMYHEYLRSSGRMAELTAMGKKDILFSNIEVVNDDLAVLYGAHKKTQKPVSVVLVEQKKGYEGGNAFHIFDEKTNKWSIQLREQSSLDKSFAEGNELFNSNTIISSLDATAPKSMAFEVKKQTTVRVKQNAGDITFDNETGVTVGRIGKEYENFKSYQDYADNGSVRLNIAYETWGKELR